MLPVDGVTRFAENIIGRGHKLPHCENAMQKTAIRVDKLNAY